MNDAQQVLVIDDEHDRLEQLVALLRAELPKVRITPWQPLGDERAYPRFRELVEVPTGLIVTDHDLTKSSTGLLGSTITGWSQELFIPVCNFSRQPPHSLPRESNFFELKIPRAPDDAVRAQYIARVFEGFESLGAYVRLHSRDQGSPAALLAGAMGYPDLQDELAPYIASVSSASSALLKDFREAGEVPQEDAQLKLQTFILGHVLVNAVLEFPGPVMSRSTLAGYCALGAEAEDRLAELFAGAVYDGPFGAPGAYFLRVLVDQRIDELAAAAMEATDLGTAAEVDEYNRAVVALALGDAPPHGCERCAGTRGGYWCPFKLRPVCNRDDCSVSSTNWIPRGATLCRVERDYYDELAPLLGE